MASRRRRSRRSWSHRLRRGLIRHRSIALRCALVIAVLAERMAAVAGSRTVRSISAAQQPPATSRSRVASPATAWSPWPRRASRSRPSDSSSASRLCSRTVSSRGCSRSPRRCRTSACLTRRRLARRLPRATRRPNLRTPSWRSRAENVSAVLSGKEPSGAAAPAAAMVARAGAATEQSATAQRRGDGIPSAPTPLHKPVRRGLDRACGARRHVGWGHAGGSAQRAGAVLAGRRHSGHRAPRCAGRHAGERS